jgi:hypothetical protein
MSGKVFLAAAGMGPKVRGLALVAKDGFSARYDLDRIRGVFSAIQQRASTCGFSPLLAPFTGGVPR